MAGLLLSAAQEDLNLWQGEEWRSLWSWHSWLRFQPPFCGAQLGKDEAMLPLLRMAVEAPHPTLRVQLALRRIAAGESLKAPAAE